MFGECGASWCEGAGSASVVDGIADGGGLHFAAAGVAADQSAEEVLAGCRCAGSVEAAACAVAGSGSSAAQELCFGESFDRHDRWMCGFFGADDDAVSGGAAEAGDVAGGDVVGVEEFFVFVPAAEDGVAGVAGVLQDRGDGGCLPAVLAAV